MPGPLQIDDPLLGVGVIELTARGCFSPVPAVHIFLSMPDQIERLAAALAGRYAFERELGAGGMATVYLARDLKHSRHVAVKVLRGELSSSLAGERFLREIEIVSQLTHPHILPLYDSGSADGGSLLYYVMPYVEGETLAHRMRREGILPIEYALQVTREVASALDFAHRRNVVHRDIKPANILLADGHAVVADFGIARAVGAAGGFALTNAGAALGTPRYWSPEQAFGATNVDGRSDIHSLGRVLYEMLVGEAPASACDPVSVEQGRFSDLPLTHERRLEDVPARVVLSMVRALAADPNQRFATAQEFAEQLAPPQRETTLWGAVTTAPVTRTRSARLGGLGLAGAAAVSLYLLVSGTAPTAIAGTATVVFVGGAVALSLMSHRRRGPGDGASIHRSATSSGQTRPSVTRKRTNGGVVESIAVLPFADLSPLRDQEYFSDGITEELLNALAKIDGLRVAARTSSFHFKAKDLDVRTIGEQLGVETLLEGSVRKSDTRVRITAQLVSAADGFHLWSDIYDRELADVLVVQEEIASKIVRALRIKLPGGSTVRDASQRALDPEAHNQYLLGRHLWNKRTKAGLEEAAEYFRRATVRDPGYAAAYAGLADAYLLLGSYHHMHPREALPLAKNAAERALALDDTLAEAHATRGQVLRSELDWRGEEQEYQRAIELNPNYATAHQWYATMLMAMERKDEARHEMSRAVELDPLSPAIGVAAGVVHFMSGETQAAIEQLERTSKVAPDFFAVHAWLMIAYTQTERFDDAFRAGERSLELNEAIGTMDLALVHAKMGNGAEALRYLAQASQAVTLWPAYGIVYALLGQRDEALSALEHAFQEDGWSFFTLHRSILLYLRVAPWFEQIRGEPRFQALVRRMHFPT